MVTGNLRKIKLALWWNFGRDERSCSENSCKQLQEGRSTKSQSLIIFSLPTPITEVALCTMALRALAVLQITTLPLSLFSNILQIRRNLQSKSTGQLFFFAVISQIAGCLARLFTTATEVGDSLLSWFCISSTTEHNPWRSTMDLLE
jgi:hypothetical protein